jgi:hypothetical protein
MTEDESNKKNLKIELHDVTVIYGRFVVLIRHDSAGVWGFKYGLTQGIGTLKIMASTGDFVREICAQKRSFSGFSRRPCMISTYCNLLNT